MRWQQLYKAGSTEQTPRDYRQADLRLVVQHRWRAGYLVDSPELRKADGRVIRLNGRENGDE